MNSHITCIKVTEAQTVQVAVKIIVVNIKVAIILKEKDSGAIEAQNIVVGINGGVTEVDALALVMFDQVIAKGELGLTQAATIDIMMNPAVFDHAAGKMSMQGIGGIADFTVT